MDINEYFSADHKNCDERWSSLEQAADAEDGAQVEILWPAFEGAMTRHLDMEEQVLFPAFEQATGMSSGPTAVMRMEHDQMRGVLRQMAAAAAAGDYRELVDQGDTLLMLVQQHNVKEEGILYPMATQRLAEQWPELQAQLAKQYPA